MIRGELRAEKELTGRKLAAGVTFAEAEAIVSSMEDAGTWPEGADAVLVTDPIPGEGTARVGWLLVDLSAGWESLGAYVPHADVPAGPSELTHLAWGRPYLARCGLVRGLKSGQHPTLWTTEDRKQVTCPRCLR